MIPKSYFLIETTFDVFVCSALKKNKFSSKFQVYCHVLIKSAFISNEMSCAQVSAQLKKKKLGTRI